MTDAATREQQIREQESEADSKQAARIKDLLSACEQKQESLDFLKTEVARLTTALAEMSEKAEVYRLDYVRTERERREAQQSVIREETRAMQAEEKLDTYKALAGRDTMTHDPLDTKRETRAALQRMWIRLNHWRANTGLRFPADERRALLRAIKHYDSEIASAEDARRRHTSSREGAPHGRE